MSNHLKLELKSNGTLEGYWSGYDNENNSITTGRYVFKKQDTAYKIRLAKVSDFPSITRIADNQLGNYLKKITFLMSNHLKMR